MCEFFFQAGEGIRVLVRTRGLGNVYKRRVMGIQSLSNWVFVACFVGELCLSLRLPPGAAWSRPRAARPKTTLSFISLAILFYSSACRFGCSRCDLHNCCAFRFNARPRLQAGGL